MNETAMVALIVESGAVYPEAAFPVGDDLEQRIREHFGDDFDAWSGDYFLADNRLYDVVERPLYR